MTRVNVVGSTLVDFILTLPKKYLRHSLQTATIELPFGQKLPTEEAFIAPGGSGANVAVGLQKLGHPTRLQTTLSDDTLANFLREELKQTDIELDLHPQQQSTQVSVVLRLEGERTILTTPAAVDPNYGEVPRQGWIHLGPLKAETKDLYRRVLSQKVMTNQGLSLNPSLATLEERPRDFLTLLRAADIIFVNKHESLVLTRLNSRSSIEDIIRSIRLLGPKIICVTAAEQGAYVASEQDIWHAAATADKNNRVDATGAGDAFTSGFLHGFFKEDTNTDQTEEVKAALVAAMLNSGSVVAQLGAQAGLLTADEIEKDRETVKLKRVDAQNSPHRW